MNWKSILGALFLGVGSLVLALNLGWIRLPVQPIAAKSTPQTSPDTKEAQAKPGQPPSPTSPGAPDAKPTAEKPASQTHPVVAQALRYLQTGKAHNPFALVPLALGAILLVWSLRRKSKETPPDEAGPAAAAVSVRTKRPRSAAKKRWHSCNVLQVRADSRELWQFESRSGEFTLDREEVLAPDQPLPAKLVARSWRSIWQPRLNIAWLPPEHVFLRVVQLPQADFAETFAMVEFQLEKLSPLPVAQIAWTFHTLPETAGEQQTVVVIIVARDIVEEFLGKLEGELYLADRLEVQLLDQMQTVAVAEDGAWIYPEGGGGKDSALVAWWYSGTLRSLGLMHAPPGENRAAQVREQLAQMAWAGELEGWLTSPPRWHLVAGSATAEQWRSLLTEGLNAPVEVIAPLSPPELAAATAQRATRAPVQANLLPAEYTKRYQQQFVDRLWMRGLLAIGALYLLGLLVYFAALNVLMFRARSVENQVAALSNTYTNAIQLKLKYEILRDRQELKYAALDCWRVTAELLPESATLNRLDFKDGRKVTLNGASPADQVTQINDFNAALRKATVGGQPLFSKVDSLNYNTDPGGTTASWSFACELNRVEEVQ